MTSNCLAIDVSHGTTHDGPGMRTTVFVKGCPLRCRWCQNPESWIPENEVWWDGTKCIGCGSCLADCPSGALSAGPDGISIDRKACRRCGACASACPAGAMSWQGTLWTMDELLHEVLKDRAYYDQFGGGVTVSGGEPLLRADFVAAFFRRLHEEGVNTALDTCGCAPDSALEKVLPFADNVLYDVKLFDGEAHRALTGLSNEQILKNLLRVAEYKRACNPALRLWIRTPLIPDATATPENIRAISAFIHDRLADVVERWEMCAFNGACAGKFARLGLEWPYAGVRTMTQRFIGVMRECALSSGLPEDMIAVSGMIAPDA